MPLNKPASDILPVSHAMPDQRGTGCGIKHQAKGSGGSNGSSKRTKFDDSGFEGMFGMNSKQSAWIHH